MRLLVVGAGVLGSQYAVRLQDAGHDVAILARGTRAEHLERDGVRIAHGRAGSVRQVRVPVVARPTGAYDLILVVVRTHQVDAVLESLAGVEGDVLFLHNWAAGPAPLGAVLGLDRVLLGFPTSGAGTMVDGVVHPRPTGPERFVRMPIGEPDGRTTARLLRVVRTLRQSGIGARTEPRMDAWLRTHAAFEVPLGLAVLAAGGPVALADDPEAVRAMIRRMRDTIGAVPGGPVPRAMGAVQVLPVGVLEPVLRRFLRSPLAHPLTNASPAAEGEYRRLAEQLAT